jgi:hypothetical protein
VGDDIVASWVGLTAAAAAALLAPNAVAGVRPIAPTSAWTPDAIERAYVRTGPVPVVALTLLTSLLLVALVGGSVARERSSETEAIEASTYAASRRVAHLVDLGTMQAAAQRNDLALIAKILEAQKREELIPRSRARGPFTIEPKALAVSTRSPKVGDTVTVTVTVRNGSGGALPIGADPLVARPGDPVGYLYSPAVEAGLPRTEVAAGGQVDLSISIRIDRPGVWRLYPAAYTDVLDYRIDGRQWYQARLEEPIVFEVP